MSIWMRRPQARFSGLKVRKRGNVPSVSAEGVRLWGQVRATCPKLGPAQETLVLV